MYNQTLEGLNLAMERIEKKYPDNYQDNKKWQQLRDYRDKLSYEYTQKELDYQKVKYANTGDEESAKLIKTYECLIEKYEKGNNNAN